MLETILLLLLSAVLAVTIHKYVHKPAIVRPNTVYISKDGNIKWLVLTKIQNMITLASPEYGIRITISTEELMRGFKKMENL